MTTNPPYGLSRLLGRESDWADLVCYLSERDPEPPRSLLELGPGQLGLCREVNIDGPIDVLVRLGANASPVALLEFKLGASLHGDQLYRYSKWAKSKCIDKLFVIGPDRSRISGIPPDWRSDISLPDMLTSWTNSSDVVVKTLSNDARCLFAEIEDMATGPADDSRGQVPDIVRIRRIYAAVENEAQKLGVSLASERSSTGYPLFAAYRGVKNDTIWTYCEVQRDRGSGPFMLRLLIGDEQGNVASSEALAKKHESWLTHASFSANLPSKSHHLVSLNNGSEFKTRSNGRGSTRYYGYKGVGQGSRMVLAPDVTLDQMIIVCKALLNHLIVFSG